MNYWLDLYTGAAWEEFRSEGARISAFYAAARRAASGVKPGDVLLCYLTGVMRWVGALEVVGRKEGDDAGATGGRRAVQFDVVPLVTLNPEQGVPMDDLEGRVAFFSDSTDQGTYKGFVRRTPNRFRRPKDGELILDMLHLAQRYPFHRPVDQKKLARKHLYQTRAPEGATTDSPPGATVPPGSSSARAATGGAGGQAARGHSGTRPRRKPERAASDATRHTEIQCQLIRLGAEMGLSIWVARNDRGKTWNGHVLGAMRGTVSRLPIRFDEATSRTVELIDVLWLKGSAIVATFEIECTTAVYSGLLRMSDLLALLPNINIPLYLVAPDRRRTKVEQEIGRPHFARHDPPLAEVCGFLPFSKLMARIKGIRRLGLVQSLRPEFLEHVAEFFTPNDSADQNRER